MAKTSPTERCLQYARGKGWLIGVVERFIPYRNIRVDLFHVADLVAISPEDGVILVQASSRPHAKKHADKILANPDLAAICRHCSVEVWSFRIPAGSRKYEIRIDKITPPAEEPV